MSKLILTGIVAAAALGLAACDRAEENNVAVENFEDLNATEDLNMDMNMDMNAADRNAADDTTGNAAVDNTTTNTGY